MAIEIKIIGKGCYFCHQLRKIVDELVVELVPGDARIEQVDRMEDLLEYGVVNPPALVVNRKLKMMGRVLVRSRIKRALEEELSALVSAESAMVGKVGDAVELGVCPNNSEKTGDSGE